MITLSDLVASGLESCFLSLSQPTDERTAGHIFKIDPDFFAAVSAFQTIHDNFKVNFRSNNQLHYCGEKNVYACRLTAPNGDVLQAENDDKWDITFG